MKNVFSKNVSMNFLYFSNDFGISKSINKGSPGLEHPEIIEFGGFGPSRNKTETLLDQIKAE